MPTSQMETYHAVAVVTLFQSMPLLSYRLITWCVDEFIKIVCFRVDTLDRMARL